MGTEPDGPKPTELYSKLSAEEQAEFGQAIVAKLKSIIGGYGELGVLSEYIVVMLQSNRPAEQIRSELDAFLQEQSGPFTEWLCDELTKVASEDAATTAKRRRKEKKAEREVAAAAGDAVALEAQQAAAERKKQKREKRNASVITAAAAAAASVPLRPREEPVAVIARSRSRKRRRRSGAEGALGEAEVANGGSASSRLSKAKLTPNVEYLRESYHQKADTKPEKEDPPPDTRWSFRADGSVVPGTAAVLGPPPGQHHYPPPHLHYQHPSPQHYPPPQAYPGPPPSTAPPTSSPAIPSSSTVSSSVRPAKYFAPKKWRVLRNNTIVRQTEKLDSPEVQKLQEGEIVEQVSPSFRTEAGLIRIQIRHPSSPLFPNPIGWVTQDATEAGGPKFLEPGPEPMHRPAPAWRPASTPSTPWYPSPAPFRPRASGGAGIPPARPPIASGRFTGNLVWKPPGANSE